MNYSVKIEGAAEDNGKIDLERLGLLIQSLTDISKGALQIRLNGTSKKRGPTSEKVGDALKIVFSGLSKGSTVLHVECNPFKETLKSLQGDVFHPELIAELENQTPMGLVMQSFSDALDNNSNTDFLDKGLLNDLKKFKKIFLSEKEVISFSNAGSVEPIILKPADIKTIVSLEEKIPEPTRVVVNGRIDLLQHSKSKVHIITDGGQINGTMGEALNLDKVASFFGKEVTVKGIASFNSKGRISYLEVTEVLTPSAVDRYFSRKQTAESAVIQVERQVREMEGTNSISGLVGAWPGNESLEDILADLD